MSSLPDNAPAPRLCHIAQWPDFQGYGFNLHAEKSKPGQFIGKIDNDSPAEMAGLKEGDRIIEVNGVNIGNENHKQVVSRIKAVPKETKLLVVDSEADTYYKGKNIVVRGDQSNVIYGTSNRDAAAPPPPEIATNGHHEEADTRSVSSHASSSAASEASTQPQDGGDIQDIASDSQSRKSSNFSTASTESPQETNQDERDSQPVAPVEESSAAPVPEEEEEVAPPPPASDPPTEEAAPPLIEEVKTVEEDNSSVEEAEPVVVEEKEEVKVTEKLEKTPGVGEEALSDLEAEYDNVNIVSQVAASTEAVAEPTPDAGTVEGSSVDGTPEEAVTAPAESVEAASSRRSSVSSSRSSVSAASAASRSSRSSAQTDPSTQSPMSTSPTPPPSLDTTSTKTPEPVSTPTPEPEPIITTTTTKLSNATINESSRQQPLANRNSFNASGLNLNMSASEMRAYLASKKKADPRRETMDLKKKYEIIQNM